MKDTVFVEHIIFRLNLHFNTTDLHENPYLEFIANSLQPM
jgi:hypothetical protein